MKVFTWLIAIVFNCAKFFIRTWTFRWELARLLSSFFFLANTSAGYLGTVRACSTGYWMFERGKVNFLNEYQTHLCWNFIYDPKTYRFCKPYLLSRILHLHNPPCMLSCLVWCMFSPQLLKTPYKLFWVFCWSSQSWKYKLLEYEWSQLNTYKSYCKKLTFFCSSCFTPILRITVMPRQAVSGAIYGAQAGSSASRDWLFAWSL